MVKHCLLLLSLLVAFSPPLPIEAAGLPRTGQTTSYAAGDDGAIRAGVSWPINRFRDNRTGTISDSLTGLIWCGDANLIASRSSTVAAPSNGAVTWQMALDYVARLNAENYLGFSDWRLPNLNELASLLNQGEPGVATWLGQQGVVNVQSSFYWSSSSVAVNAAQAWGINFNTGMIAANSKSSPAHIWPVRGGVDLSAAMVAVPKTGQMSCFNTAGEEIVCVGSGQDGELRTGNEWPNPRFSERGDGTLNDNLTGLVWAKNANLIAIRDATFGGNAVGRVLWPDALEFVTGLNREAYLGYTDWRLPNRNELLSLINYAESNSTGWISRQGFSDAQPHYWSSGTSALTPANAWDVFLSGDVAERNKYDTDQASFVWPVRGGIDISQPALPAPATRLAAFQSSAVTVAQVAAVTLAVSSGTLPAGTVGTVYSQTLAATGGTAPYTWSRKSGSLPAGLTLSTAGVISGTPTTAATSTFTVQVKDTAAKTATKSLSITINAAPLSITSASLADGYLASAYSQTLTAVGGKTAYSWSIISGTLPAGLTLAASTGKISGTPTATGTSSITLQAKDANNSTASKSLTMVVYALPAITSASLPPGSIGTAYSQQLTVSGGKAAYLWSVSSGTLPAGLSLNAASGVISGIPTTPGTSSVTFKVTDTNAKSATKALSITINTTPPIIVTTALPDGVVSITYSQALSASGGKTPYSWSRTSGTLPTGLTLSSSGVISGTPTTAGSSSFTVQLKDANNALTTRGLNITIVPALGVVNSGVPEGGVGSAYNQTVVASGGKAPYSWSIIAGVLPMGLVLNSVSGVISGTPTAAGWSDFTIQVKDANNSIASAQISMYINPPLSISTTTLPGDYIGTPYNQTLTCSGGTLPCSWAIISGTLPAGLVLDPVSGSISGTPTVAGSSSFTVQARDAGNATVALPLSISVTPFGSISGVVTDQAGSTPLAGVAVTLKLNYANNDPNNRVFSCNNSPITSADYQTITSNDGNKYSCATNVGNNTMLFKVRNPFGVPDPFTVNWNGIATLSGYDTEYLAQSFKPTKSGALTKASFHLNNLVSTQGGSVSGSIYVLLKSKLGGDRGTYLAMSNSISLSGLRGTTPTWVDFTFPEPVALMAGGEYYLEINGTFFDWYGGAYLYNLFWDGATFSDGFAYARHGGIWSKLNSSLAFRTYLDEQSDITVAPVADSSHYMDGGNDVGVGGTIFSPANGKWWTSLGFNTLFPDSDGYDNYNGDDLTGEATVGSALSDYYDATGWLTVKIWSYSTWATALTTDYFDIIFNRTFTTTTDANGAYSFASLPDGGYTLTLDKSAYLPATSRGTLTPGQLLNLNTPLAKAATATLQGIIQHTSFGPVPGVTVTITDPLGSRTTSSDSEGNYRIDGITYGNFTVVFEAQNMASQTFSGYLAPSQVLVKNIWVYGAPVTLSVDSPADGALVSVVPCVLTGSAINADTVTMITTNNGVQNYYTATLVNNLYSVSLPIAAGQTTITIYAENKFRQSAIKSITVTRAPFIFRDMGDSGNVTVMEADGNYDAKNSDGSTNDQPRKSIATEYFRNHDDVDFLVFLSTFDYAMLEATAKGFYSPVRNDTQGINQLIVDNSAQFGSQGSLQGTIDLGNISSLALNPHGPKLEETVTTLNHELMHRFGAHVRFKNTDGTLNGSLLGKDNAHWSYLLDSKGSLMYGNAWYANANGTFTSTAAMSAFSPLDLYLMGMIPKEQVPPMLLIDNPVIDKTQLPNLGATVTGAAKTVTIDDIIAAEGPRIPDASTSQKQFNVGFVLLTRSGDNATAATQAIETLRKAWAGRFAELTQGKGGVANIPASLEVTVDSPAEGTTITGPDVTVSGAVINTSGVETGITVNGIPATISGNRFVVNHVALQAGSNTITITATDSNGLTATTSRTVADQAGGYIRIGSNIESGTAPLSISLRLDGSFSIASSQVSGSGPVPVTLASGTSATEYTATLTAEGTYTFTASVVGPDGQTYNDSVTVTVIPRYQLETLLKGKWDTMRQKLTTGDVDGAVANFVSYNKTKYREAFIGAASFIPTIVAQLSPIELVEADSERAKFRMMRFENIMEQQEEIEYVIYFVKESGLWKLRKL